MNRRDSHIIYQRIALRPTKRIIFIDLHCQNFKSRLIDKHQLIINSHGLLFQKLELTIVESFFLKFCKVIELYEVSDFDTVWVEVAVKASRCDDEEETEDVAAKSKLMMPVSQALW